MNDVTDRVTHARYGRERTPNEVAGRQVGSGSPATVFIANENLLNQAIAEAGAGLTSELKRHNFNYYSPDILKLSFL